ncbi:TVP38/TMEM64 family protein [Desulfovibrio cuneatus]|uniref:TVP38/TMEM64 family protein n=1 Tax=Desulfovibrio cuneatus TaxID=159728 RepID=UPI00041C6C3C|nr:VTT domain-containing protein [Desulfovibrio cuneatus]
MHKNIVVFVVLITIAVLARLLDLDEMLEATWLHTHIVTQGAKGIALFVGLTAVFSALGIPRQLLAFAGGFAFGIGYGLGWALLGLTLGCTLGFYTARLVGQGNLPHKVHAALKRIEPFLQYKPFLMALCIRLMPIGNNALTSMAAGVSHVPAASFIAGSAVGYLPQTIIFVLLGSGIQLESTWQTGLSIVLFLISSALGTWLYRRYRRHAAMHRAPLTTASAEQ